MTFLKDYLSPTGRIGAGIYGWRMTVGTIIWGLGFSAALISGVPADLRHMLSIWVVILLYMWLSLAVQRARDIGYSPTLAASCFLGCFVFLPIISKVVCSKFFSSDVCSGDTLPKLGLLVILPLFLALFQPSNSFQRQQRQSGSAQN